MFFIHQSQSRSEKSSSLYKFLSYNTGSQFEGSALVIILVPVYDKMVKKKRTKKSLRALMETSSEKYTEVSINKARKLAADILEDPTYQKNLMRRAQAGVLAPAIEMMLWYYLFGKPAEKVNVNVSSSDLYDLTDNELAIRTKELNDIAVQVVTENQKIVEIEIPEDMN